MCVSFWKETDRVSPKNIPYPRLLAIHYFPAISISTKETHTLNEPHAWSTPNIRLNRKTFGSVEFTFTHHQAYIKLSYKDIIP